MRLIRISAVNVVQPDLFLTEFGQEEQSPAMCHSTTGMSTKYLRVCLFCLWPISS